MNASPFRAVDTRASQSHSAAAAPGMPGTARQPCSECGSPSVVVRNDYGKGTAVFLCRGHNEAATRMDAINAQIRALGLPTKR